MLLNFQLAHIQAMAARFLTQTCEIQREGSTRGKMGEKLHNWETAQADVPCRVIMEGRKTGDATQIVGQRETQAETYKLALPPDATIDVDYRVIVEGVTYSVVRLEKALTDRVFRHAWIVKER